MQLNLEKSGQERTAPNQHRDLRCDIGLLCSSRIAGAGQHAASPAL